MKRLFTILAAIAMPALLLGKENESARKADALGGYAPKGYRLVWSDEFDSPAAFYRNWFFEQGGTGWGNGELQYYCDGGIFGPADKRTATFGDGSLKIRAFKVAPSDATANCAYISARLNTRASWQHGYIEMRAKLPKAKGCWPAFWMLLKDGPSYVRDESRTGGEIDIMEYVPGDDPSAVHFSAHSYYATGEAGRDTGYVDPATGTKHSYSRCVKVADPEKWHCYGMEWTHEFIRAYCDGVEYFYAPNPSPGKSDAAAWPFDQAYYIKLNLAVGGSWGGTPAADLDGATYEIDWVRVYQK